MSTEEKRRFPRLPINTEVEYTIPDQEEAELFTTGSKNISSGGVCIVAFEKLEPGVILDLKFSIPALNKFIIAKGRVAWIKELHIVETKIGKIYEAGIEFVNIKDADREKIQEFITLRTEAFIRKFMRKIKAGLFKFFPFFKKTS